MRNKSYISKESFHHLPMGWIVLIQDDQRLRRIRVVLKPVALTAWDRNAVAGFQLSFLALQVPVAASRFDVELFILQQMKMCYWNHECGLSILALILDSDSLTTEVFRRRREEFRDCEAIFVYAWIVRVDCSSRRLYAAEDAHCQEGVVVSRKVGRMQSKRDVCAARLKSKSESEVWGPYIYSPTLSRKILKELIARHSLITFASRELLMIYVV